MFSSRFHFDLTLNRLMETLQAKRAAGVEVLDLAESNPTRAGFDYAAADILSALTQPQAMLYEPTPRGLPVARLAITNYYLQRNKTIHPDSLFLTASTSEAYGHLFKLLADPGDEVLVPKPSYPLLDFLTALDSVRPIQYPTTYNSKLGWRIDTETLPDLITDKTKAIVVVSPNNPTGSYLKTNELAQLNALCAKNNLALIVDEVFSDYRYQSAADQVETAVGNEGALTFVLSGLSKIIGLPQVKLGWIQVSGPASLVAETQSRLEFIADTYLSVATPVQHAAERLLAQRQAMQKQIIARLDDNHRFLEAQCAKLPNCRPLLREGGWYAVLEIDDDGAQVSDDERVQQLLEQDNIFVHPGYFYDFDQDGILVLSLLTPPAIFQAGVSKILAHIRMI
ncbi:MAG: pyridoxal phosphate-dependent aminotransferase [Chloroflexi bacterium]|nr:pyridoxal phosphate-dependent aminotransferase [Chloroflexota bacterium]